MSANRLTRVVLPAFVLLGLSAHAASAQAANPKRAERMLQQAVEIEQVMHEQGPTKAARLEAARLHLESAGARSTSDPEAVTSLVMAARHIGSLDPERAASILSRAAEHALALGDVETAAHAYIDAAIALRESKTAFTQSEGTKLSGWHHKANLLSNSPLLTASQRDRITNRLFPTTLNAF